MWIFSELGFFSVARQKGVVHVRARSRADLLALARAVGISAARVQASYPGSDYPYRILLQAESELDDIMLTLSERVRYDNFKQHMMATPAQMDKGHALASAWAAMRQWQEGREGA